MRYFKESFVEDDEVRMDLETSSVAAAATEMRPSSRGISGKNSLSTCQ